MSMGSWLVRSGPIEADAVLDLDVLRAREAPKRVQTDLAELCPPTRRWRAGFTAHADERAMRG